MELVNTDVSSEDWLGFDWSSWRILEPGTKRVASVPDTSGFFRVKQQDRPGLEYVGQTGRSLHERITHLAHDLHKDERPKENSSAYHLWELRDFGGRFEFSYTNPNIARSETDRIGLENVMFATHIKQEGRSPTVNLNRRLSGDEDESVLQDIKWDSPGDFTADDWMGLDWTEPRPLGKRTEISDSKVVYRIWFEKFVPPLAYIGKSTNVANRLIKHEKKFGSDALFSVAPLESNFKDVEAVLISAHYTTTNTLPKGQDGRRNKFSWKLEG